MNYICIECKLDTTYGKTCRDCYENSVRRSIRDDYYRNIDVIQKRMLNKERCQMNRKKFTNTNEHLGD